MGRKRLLISLVITLAAITIYPAEKYLTLGSENTDEASLDNIIQSEQFFKELQEEYSVNGIGVGKEERIITVRVDRDENEQELSSFLNRKLNELKIVDYEIEIFKTQN